MNRDSSARVFLRDDLEQSGEVINNLDAIWLACPDRAIAETVQRLTTIPNVNWNSCLILHSSGVTDLGTLTPIAESGAATLVAHPNTILVKGEKFESGLVWGIDGARKATDWFRALIAPFQPRFVNLAEIDSVLYHASATVAANYSMVLYDTARSLLREAGVQEDLIENLVTSYWRRVMQLIEGRELSEVLSGPVQRGDEESIERHLNRIESADANLAERLAHFIAATQLAVEHSTYNEKKDRITSNDS